MRVTTLLLAAALSVGACQHVYTGAPPVTGGERYETVRDVQRGLTELRYYRGPIDGYAGPATRDAIARYQRDRGLQVTRAIDRALLRSLERDLGGGARPAPEPGRNEVRQVQSDLSQLGYYRGRVDGSMGRGTRQAIRRYQSDRSLPVTGDIDRRLLRALRRDLASSDPQPQPAPSGGYVRRGDLPDHVRVALDRRWRRYQALRVDLDRDGDLDVIARTGFRQGSCRNANCDFVVLRNDRRRYREIGNFQALDASPGNRRQNGFRNIRYSGSGAVGRGVLRYDGRRYR